MDISKSFNMVTDKVQTWLTGIITLLPNLIVAVLVMIIFYLIARLVKKLLRRLSINLSSSTQVAKLISSTAYLAVLSAGLIIALGVLQLEKTVTSLLAGAGIVGLALSFAFQDIATNFVSGFLIIIRKPFREGDIIESDGYFGIADHINFRYTGIRTFQGQAVIIPNKTIFQNPLINYSLHGERRIDLAVGISYGDDLKKVKSVTIDAVQKMEHFDNSKEVTLYFDEFGDSSINFKVNFWVKYDNHVKYLNAKSEAIMNIKAAYDANGITIPFPIRTLDFGIKGGEKLSEMNLSAAS